MPTKHRYEIELVEAEKERVKIQYVGYSDKYDEWKLKEVYDSLNPKQPVSRAKG